MWCRCFGGVAAAFLLRGVAAFTSARAPPGRLVLMRSDYLSQLMNEQPPPDDYDAPIEASTREAESQARREEASARAAARIEGYRRGEGPPRAQAAPPPMPPPVPPPGWERLLDEASGQPYYWNSATGESSWDLPSAVAAPPEAAPPVWKRLVDEASGDSYYWNSVTGESSWDAPAAEDSWDAPEAPAEEETEEDLAAKAARREMIRVGSTAAAERMRAAMTQTGRASDSAAAAGVLAADDDRNLPWRRKQGPPAPAPISPAPAPPAAPVGPPFEYDADRQQVTQLMMMLVSYSLAVSGAPGAQMPPPEAAPMLAKALRATGELLRAELGS